MRKQKAASCISLLVVAILIGLFSGRAFATPPDPVLAFIDDEDSFYVYLETSASSLDDWEVSLVYKRFADTLVAPEEDVIANGIERIQYPALLDVYGVPEGVEAAYVEIATDPGLPDGVYCQNLNAQYYATERGRRDSKTSLSVHFMVANGIPERISLEEYSANFEVMTDGIDRFGNATIEFVGMAPLDVEGVAQDGSSQYHEAILEESADTGIVGEPTEAYED